MDRSSDNQRSKMQNQYASYSAESIQILDDSASLNLASEGSEEGSLSSTKSTDDESKKHQNEAYTARHVIELLVPISMCMMIVLATLNSVSSHSTTNGHQLYAPFREKSYDSGTRFWHALVNSMYLMIIIVLMTIFLIVLYKKRCYKIIQIWLIVSSFMLLFIFSCLYFEDILCAYNIPMDYLTGLMIIWNFGITGMIALHWQSPLSLQQGYLIFIAALMALVFIKHLPKWTTWTVLVIISIWDLISVLSSKGPLRILVQTSQKRNEQIFPALIYSSTAVLYTYMGTNPPNSVDNATSIMSTDAEDFPEANCIDQGFETEMAREIQLKAINSPNSDDSTVSQEERSIKLGLGDFIFYSVLVGKVSSFGDWATTIACFVAILIGLCLTLLLLGIWRKALPALPISITFGLIFYFAASTMVKPLMDNLSMEQIFI